MSYLKDAADDTRVLIRIWRAIKLWAGGSPWRKALVVGAAGLLPAGAAFGVVGWGLHQTIAEQKVGSIIAQNSTRLVQLQAAIDLVEACSVEATKKGPNTRRYCDLAELRYRQLMSFMEPKLIDELVGAQAFEVMRVDLRNQERLLDPPNSVKTEEHWSQVVFSLPQVLVVTVIDVVVLACMGLAWNSLHKLVLASRRQRPCKPRRRA